ncbi:hypothetical protein [Spirosoma arcticum]
MNNQLASAFGPTPANTVGLRQQYGSVLLMGLLAVMSACNATRTDSTKGQRLRLTVGDIKEVSIDARPDSTNQLTATSDNQEVVDVSRKPTDTTAPNGPQLSTAGPTVFLIKGVTAGTARVVFSEKPVGEDGTGRVKKAYVVTVVNK